jgi:small subunit ribosomal protein S5
MFMEWEPKTKLGRMVKEGKFASLDEVLATGKPILEPEIVDYFIPNLKSVTIEINATQRMTDSGRRTSYRAIVLVGDEKGHVGYGVGKANEVAAAIAKATQEAKKNIIKVNLGCGSWECRCGQPHSIPFSVEGKESASQVVLKPAPRGLGLVANETIKQVLSLAGVKDVWSQARGSTGNKYNIVLATFKALRKLGGAKQ